jgi:hypothetical protein
MKELSRRALLRAAALTAAAVPFASMSMAEATTTNLYARPRFVPYLNKAFTLTAGGVSYAVVLTAIQDLSPKGKTNDPDRFRLTFRTAVAGPSQQTCSLSRSGFTATPLFVVPIGSTSRTYEAIVNRTG